MNTICHERLITTVFFACNYCSLIMVSKLWTRMRKDAVDSHRELNLQLNNWRWYCCVFGSKTKVKRGVFPTSLLVCQAAVTWGEGEGWMSKPFWSKTYGLCSLMIVITTESSEALVILKKVEAFPRLSVSEMGHRFIGYLRGHVWNWVADSFRYTYSADIFDHLFIT